MKKIVIIKGTDRYTDYDDYTFLIKNAEPLEVEEADYQILRTYIASIYNDDGTSYKMLEFIQPAELVDVLTVCRERHARAEAAAAKRRESRARQIAKSEAEKISAKRKQLEKLKKELGVK